MADKDIVLQIQTRERERVALLGARHNDSVLEHVDSHPAEVAEGLALADTFDWLAGDLRAVADLRERAKQRGGTSAAKVDREVAGRLQLLAIELRKPAAKVAHAATVPTRPIERTHTVAQVDAFVQEQAQKAKGAEVAGPVTPIAEVVFRSPEDTIAYLQNATEETSVHVPQFIDPPTTIVSQPDGWAYTTARETLAAAPTAFTDPSGPGSREIPGPRVTWGELSGILGQQLGPDELRLPEHLSHSQVSTLADCGTKYLLQRSETLGVVQVPQWALIGGKAFHACVEQFELLVAEVKTPQFVKDRWGVLGGSGPVWYRVFGAEVTQTAIDNPEVPMDLWRASKQGKEGYTWWLIEGESMVETYVAARMAELEAPWRAIRTADFQDEATKTYGVRPMIEHEFEMTVAGVPFKGVIDQVWDITAPHGPMRPGDILIDDAKSGAKVAGDTAQLGEYAAWLAGERGTQTSMIWGRFYDARKGTWTEPVNLLERHPYERFAYEVAAADRKKRAGVFEPRPSLFCGGCSVKHACPIFATRDAA